MEWDVWRKVRALSVPRYESVLSGTWGDLSPLLGVPEWYGDGTVGPYGFIWNFSNPFELDSHDSTGDLSTSNRDVLTYLSFRSYPDTLTRWP